MGMEERPVRMFRSWVFSIGVTIVSSVLLARDRLRGITKGLASPAASERFFFRSGQRRLAASYLGIGSSAPVILICHGIAETVEHWGRVQQLLAESGVGSMVFNYSGYGASSGRICAEHCDEDLLAAYAELRKRVGDQRPVFLLGFSMGSGIAAHGAAALQPPISGLFLCEAFSSFQNAVRAAHIPGWLTRFVPEIWDSTDAVRRLQIPIYVIHSDGDQLFPVEMADEIVRAAGAHAELILIPGTVHDEPYREPTQKYWGPVIARMLRRRRS